MKVNRFTDIKTAQYNPMSLEELMMVPMMKRGQHDKLTEDIATTKAALAQTDYMDIHGEQVSGLRKKLEAELQRQVDQVSSSGINQTLRTDFTNLNAEYQNAVGPKGVFGAAAAAKASVAKNREELMANAVKMNHDPAATGRRFDEKLEEYRQKQIEKGEISDMEAVLPPKYEDFEKDLLWTKQMLGETVETEKGKEGYEVELDETLGQYVIKSESGAKITSSNKENIEDALAFMTTKWLEEGGAGRKSDEWNEVDVDARQKSLESGLNIMRKESIKDGINTNFKVVPKGKSTDASDDKSKKKKPRSTYTSTGLTSSIFIKGATSQEMKNTVAAIMKNPGDYTPKEIREARQFEIALLKADKEFTGTGLDENGNKVPVNNTYNHYKKELEIIDEVNEQLGLKDSLGLDATAVFGQTGRKHHANTGEKYYFSQKKDGNYELVRENKNGITKLSKGKTITPAQYKKFKAAEQISAEFEKYEEEYKKDVLSREGLHRTDITIPYETSAERNVEAMNLKHSLNANNSKPDHIMYMDSAGNGTEIEATEAQSRAVMQLFTQSKENSVNTINVSKIGGQVGITVNFTPQQGAELEIAGWFNDKDFDGAQAIEMFVPIDKLIDEKTGQKHTPTQIFEQLGRSHPEVQAELEKLVATNELSATPNEANLGAKGVPVEQYFPKGLMGPEGSILDFKVEYGGTGKYTVPYVIDGETKSRARWDQVLTDDLFEDTPEGDAKVAALIDSNLYVKMMESSKILIDEATGQTLNKKHPTIFGKEEATSAEIEAWITDLMGKEMKLKTYNDILEVSKYTQTIQ